MSDVQGGWKDLHDAAERYPAEFKCAHNHPIFLCQGQWGCSCPHGMPLTALCVLCTQEGQTDPLTPITECGLQVPCPNLLIAEEPRAMLSDLLYVFGPYTAEDRARLALLQFASEVFSGRWTGNKIETMQALIKAYNNWRSGLKSKLEYRHYVRVLATMHWPDHLQAWQEAQRNPDEVERERQEAEAVSREAEREARRNMPLSFNPDDYEQREPAEGDEGDHSHYWNLPI